MRYRPSRSPTLELMKAETPAGRCVFCPAPAVRGVTCGDEACVASWWEVYELDVLDNRKAFRAARNGLQSLSHHAARRLQQGLTRRARRAA